MKKIIMKKIIRNYLKIKNIIANNINNIHNVKKIFVVKFNNKIILLENQFIVCVT